MIILKLIKKLLAKSKAKSFFTSCKCTKPLIVTRHSYVKNYGNKNDIVIEKNCCIRGGLINTKGGKIKIGSNTYIGNNTVIGAKKEINIGNNVIISDDVIIFDNNNHPTSPKKRLEMSQSNSFFGELWSWDNAYSSTIHIEDNVWIGKRAVILKGVRIGRGSIVALGAIVTKDVPPYSVAAGNPAKVVKTLDIKE